MPNVTSLIQFLVENFEDGAIVLDFLLSKGGMKSFALDEGNQRFQRRIKESRFERGNHETKARLTHSRYIVHLHVKMIFFIEGR